VATAAVLTDKSKWDKTYELGGPGFTLTELAATISAESGTTIPYIDMPPEGLGAALTGAQLPEFAVKFIVDSDVGISKGQLDVDSSTLETLVGRPLMTAAEAVRTGLAAIQ